MNTIIGLQNTPNDIFANKEAKFNSSTKMVYDNFTNGENLAIQKEDYIDPKERTFQQAGNQSFNHMRHGSNSAMN